MDKDKQNDPHRQQRTAQEYIDEKPKWPSGERWRGNSISSTQWMIWWLAGAGKFFEGMLVFMSGVALPLVAQTYQINSVEKGLYTAIVLIGILIGASLLGGLADHYGRRKMFIFEFF